MNAPIDRRKRIRIAAFATGLATLICLAGHVGAIGLVGPDEPRYAWIARAMAQTGDWVTPRLYGSPWFEKPILYYWAAAIGFKAHLPAEWAARLPSALAALAAALCVAWLAWRYYGIEEFCPWSPALLGPLFFATSVAAIGFARAATPDMLFAASLTFAMASAARTLEDGGALRGSASSPAGGRSPGALFSFGAFLGLAVLAKGPAALLLAGGAVAIWALATRQWTAAFRLLHANAVAAFCVVALPWYIVCAHRNADFLRIFIFQHNFERYLTPIFQHRQPFWFFIPITALAVLPWTAFLIPAARDGLQLWLKKTWHNSPAFFFACWAFFPILFFSFSQSKLPGYMLPSMPALSLVMAVSAARSIERESRAGLSAFILLGLTWIGLGAAGLIWRKTLPAIPASQMRAPLIVCAALVILAGFAMKVLAPPRQRAAIWISLLVVSVCVESAGIGVLPAFDPYVSARSAGTMIRGDLRPDRLFIYEMPRAWQYGLAFYLGREIPDWSPTDREAALVLTTPKGFEEMKSRNYWSGTLDEPSQGIVFVPMPAKPPATR